MFFLHALLLFFLLDTTLFSMAAVLPRNAGGYGYLHTRGVPSGAAYQPVGPKGNGFGNLHIRDTSPGLAELDGYWELDSDGSSLTFIHFQKGKFNGVFYRLNPGETKQVTKEFESGAYQRVKKKDTLDAVLARQNHPEFSLPPSHQYDWLDVKNSAGVITVRFGKSKGDWLRTRFTCEAVKNPEVGRSFAEEVHAVIPPSPFR